MNVACFSGRTQLLPTERNVTRQNAQRIDGRKGGWGMGVAGRGDFAYFISMMKNCHIRSNSSNNNNKSSKLKVMIKQRYKLAALMLPGSRVAAV